MRAIEFTRPRSKLQGIPFVFLGIILTVGGVIGLVLPILPGVLLLVAGAGLLSRECPALHRAIEEFQARFPVVRRYVAGVLTAYATWRNHVVGTDRDSATATPVLNPTTWRLETLEMLRGQREKKQNAGGTESACAAFKILVFDQYLEDLTWHAESFESHGFEVYKCMTIEAALRCIEREELDFALVDQASGAFEGLRVIRHLVRYNLRTPFIVLSREHNMNCYRQAISFGAVDYLQKPVPVAKMNWIIDRYFGTPANGKELETNTQC
jgi:CheY-like chemotaxis protein